MTKKAKQQNRVNQCQRQSTRAVSTSTATHSRVKRVLVTEVPVAPPPPETYHYEPPSWLDVSSSDELPAYATEPSVAGATPDIDRCPSGITVKRKKIRHTHNVLQEWKESYRQRYLDECLLLEGRGRFWQYCTSCHRTEAQFRCKDCHAFEGLCRDCVVATHRSNPLHVIEVSKY
jgi:hypothetical protein